MNLLRFGIVGSGKMAHVRAERIIKNPRAQLTCIASRNHSTGQELADAYGVPFLLDWRSLILHDHVDAVLVATHQNTHALMCLNALQVGKHVFTESPMALSSNDADTLIQCVRETQRILCVGHTSILQSVHMVMKQEVDKIGDMMFAVMHIHWSEDSDKKNPALQMETTGHPFFMGTTLAFPLFDLCHKAIWVEANSSFRNLDTTGKFDSCVTTMQIGFAQGNIGQVIYARGLSQPGKSRRRFVGSRGSLEFQDNDSNVLKISSTGEVDIPIPATDTWQLEIDGVVNAVLEKSPMLVSLESARRIVTIAEGAITSQTEGRRIILE